MTHTWEYMEGVSLAGIYGLEQWLGSDPSGAFFLTSFGPDRERAVVKMVLDDPSESEAQLALWRRTARLHHPGLLGLLDCGRADLGGERFLFAVFEAPDDSLAEAVRNGPFSEEEARDVLAAAAGALQFLHEHGWAHASIDAEHVVAVGDRIKLASDTLRDGDPAAQAADVWALGALTYELLTSWRIAPGQYADLSGIPDPLRTIIGHAIEPDADRRFTAAQLSAAVSGGMAAPAPEEIASPLREQEPALNQETLAPEFEPTAEPLPATGLAPAPPLESAVRPPAIVVHEPFSVIGSGESAPEPQRPAESPLARYVPLAAAAAVLLLAVLFVVAQHGTPPPPAVAIVPPPVQEPVKPILPVKAAPAKPAAPAAPASPQTWRVIAFTYSRYQDAEKKVQSINSRLSGIHAEVFRVGSSYLVSLGAHLTRDAAAALRRTAIGKGLPRDTFIQNYSN